MNASLNRLLKRYHLPPLSEQVVSMILGALVVILVSLLAYRYFATIKVGPATNVTAPQTSEPGEISEGETAVALPTTHTVAAGENLWVIAEKYFRSGYNFVDIAKANELSNPNFLEAGQKLTIPKVKVRQPLTVSGATTPTITDSRIEGTSYTVVKGDDLWQIAVRAYGDGYKWVEIAKANNLVNPNLIHPGNVLALPR